MREEQDCPDAAVSIDAIDGALVLAFREAPGAPLVTVRCNYGDCEWVLTGIHCVRKRKPFDRLLRQHAATSEDGRLLFATIRAKRGRLEWEVAAPFGIAGYTCDMSGADLDELQQATLKAMAQEDAKP